MFFPPILQDLLAEDVVPLSPPTPTYPPTTIHHHPPTFHTHSYLNITEPDPNPSSSTSTSACATSAIQQSVCGDLHHDLWQGEQCQATNSSAVALTDVGRDTESGVCEGRKWKSCVRTQAWDEVGEEICSTHGIPHKSTAEKRLMEDKLVHEWYEYFTVLWCVCVCVHLCLGGVVIGSTWAYELSDLFVLTRQDLLILPFDID